MKRSDWEQDIANVCKGFSDKGQFSSGIIYWIKKKDTEELTKNLKTKYNISWEYFHADINISKRNEIQEKWMKNKIQIIVATIAFGMGINK